MELVGTRPSAITAVRIEAQEMQIRLAAPAVGGEAMLSLIDVLGRVLHTQSVRETSSRPTIVRLPRVGNGWYLVVLARNHEPIAAFPVIAD